MVTTATEDLLAQALADPAQRGPLLEQCANYLKMIARSQFDRRIQARLGVSDIVQDTLLEAHRDFPKFRGRGMPEFLAWLRKVLLNNLAQAMDGHLGAGKRDVRREQHLETLTASVEGSARRVAELLGDRRHSPSAAAMQHEELLALADALHDLPQEYCEVIVSRHLEGLPFREIAQRMGRSEGAARMLWFRAMDRLRTILDQKGVL